MISDFLTIDKDSESLSTEDTIKIFENMGLVADVKKIVKPIKMVRCRPVFTPNGNLLTITSKNEIKEV